ncbi:MAG: molecular chaperone DnaK, partial [Clostridia bacterium]|nr:molecular chaperone DnaK [Clostridia bacterium]
MIESGFAYYDYTLTRERFETMIRPLIDATVDKVFTILRNAGLTGAQVDHVVLVGGSSQIPLVRQSLRRLFGDKVRINIDIEPALAVAMGAALYRT